MRKRHQMTHRFLLSLATVRLNIPAANIGFLQQHARWMSVVSSLGLNGCVPGRGFCKILLSTLKNDGGIYYAVHGFLE